MLRRWMLRHMRSPTACATRARPFTAGRKPPEGCWGSGWPARPWPPSGCLAPYGSSPHWTRATSRSSTCNPRSSSATSAMCSPFSGPTCSCSHSTRWRASPGSLRAVRCPCRRNTTRASRAGCEHGGRIAIGFVCCATAFSLSAQAYVIGHGLAGVSHFLRVSPGLLLWGLLPHAIPELIALFLPLAAWIIASRRGEWEQLLAATFVTVAVAVPVLVIAAFIEVYVSPHVFVALTHIHEPIVRNSEGWVVTVR